MSEGTEAVKSPTVDSNTSKRRPVRVCHVAYTFYENDNRVRRYAEALAEQGDDVEVLALRRRGQEAKVSVGGVQVLKIQRRSVTERHPIAYLLKIVYFFMKSTVVLSIRHLRRPFDVVHVHNVPDFLVFTALVPKLMGAHLILDIHDILPELYAGKFGVGRESMTFRALLWIERLSCRFADHVIVANHLWHEKLTKRALDPQKCSTMLNYPDLRVFRPSPLDDKRSDSKFVMLYPGTLNHHQGLDIAIRALAIAGDQMPNAELHIYGEGPVKLDLVRLARDCRISDRVRFMDLLPLETIAPIIAAADVGIVPKRANGFGNEAFSTKILEFMACCVPVIVSRTMVDEHYFDDKLVRFFVPENETDLAHAMVEVYLAGHKNLEWIAAARRFGVQNSWQQRVHEYLHLVDSLGRTSRHRPALVN